MSGIKRKTHKTSQQIGSETYCFQAPEEFHVWTLENKWNDEAFRKYGVQIEGIRITSRDTVGFPHVEPFNQTDKKLVLKADAIVTEGEFRTFTTVKGLFNIRLQSVYAANKALSELSEKCRIKSWEVLALDIYNPQHASYLKYMKFNPNKKFSSLYLKYITHKGIEKQWADIPLTTQQMHVGKFKGDLAHCTTVKRTIIDSDCAIETKVIKNQIKLRKKK